MKRVDIYKDTLIHCPEAARHILNRAAECEDVSAEEYDELVRLAGDTKALDPSGLLPEVRERLGI